MTPSALHDRLQAAVGEMTYRQLAELTGANAETVRRYMQGQPPAVEFLAAVCRAFGVSGDWLLMGRGPMRAKDVRPSALAESSAGELFTAVAGNVEGLIGRVERLERYVQTLETQFRGRPLPDARGVVGAALGPALGVDARAGGAASAPPGVAHDVQPASVQAGSKLERFRAALAQRPHEDDD